MKAKGIRLQMLLFGIMVIAAGVLLLLFKVDIIPIEYKSIIFSWQMLLISLGVLSFFHRPRPHVFAGVVLVLVGGLFIISKFNYPPLAFVKDNLLAVVLLAGGFIIFVRALFGRHFKSKCPHRNYAEDWRKQCEAGFEGMKKKDRYKGNYAYKDEAGYIYHNYFFGGGKENFGKAEFKGGEINCMFGGLELDLSDAQLAEGINNLTINTMFGGVVLTMPIDWKVEIRHKRVFGHFEDRRPKPSFEIDDSRMLIIYASCMFGGGEIKFKTNND